MTKTSRGSRTLFDDALAKGAKVAVGGTLEAADRTIHPTLLTEVTPDMLIMQEEIFGPVVPVITYKKLDEVISFICDRGKPLALYIYSNTPANVRQDPQPDLIGRRDHQRILLALPGKPVAVWWRQPERDGQLSRRVWLQGVLAREGHLCAAEPVGGSCQGSFPNCDRRVFLEDASRLDTGTSRMMRRMALVPAERPATDRDHRLRGLRRSQAYSAQ